MAFINLSRFKPAYINISRLKFRINERTIQFKSKPSIVNTKMRMSKYHQFAYLIVESEQIAIELANAKSALIPTGKLHPMAARHILRQLRVGFT